MDVLTTGVAIIEGFLILGLIGSLFIKQIALTEFMGLAMIALNIAVIINPDTDLWIQIMCTALMVLAFFGMIAGLLLKMKEKND